MGTNYYVKGEGCCRTCRQRNGSDLHIGKSSSGWCFSLQTHDEPKIENIEDWKAYLVDTIITDEYDRVVSYDEMFDIIENRSFKHPDLHRSPEFLRMNHAEEGPNNLLRHKVDGSHCIAQGDGTFDYMRGEFF